MKRLRRAALGVVLLVSMACTAGAGGSAEAYIRALRYPGGYDGRTHENLKDSTFTVSFRARLPYPSETVLNFYEREVEKLGWSPIDKAGEGYRTWLCYEDATRPGSPFVHQLGARWVNSDESRMIFVIVLYISQNVPRRGRPCPRPESDVQQVHVQLMPFVLPPK